MKVTELASGVTRIARHAVTAQMSPPHLKPEEVLGTSALVELMENAAHETVAAALEPDQTTVGSRIDIHHRKPAFPGDQVEIVSTLRAVGRRLVFDIVASVDDTIVATSTHERAVIQRSRLERPLTSPA